jgi:hypothetical protein
VLLTFERFPDHVGTFGGSFDDPNKLGLTSDIVRQVFTVRRKMGLSCRPVCLSSMNASSVWMARRMSP